MRPAKLLNLFPPNHAISFKESRLQIVTEGPAIQTTGIVFYLLSM